MKGRKHTEEAKAKNSAANLGRRRSVATEFKAGIQPANKKDIDTKHIADLYDSGLSAKRISETVGLSKACVLRRLRSAGVEVRSSAEVLRTIFTGRPKELHPRWKGGATPANVLIRQSTEYAEWRTAVFKRDAYTCVICLAKGVPLHGDHIKPFSLFPELRFDVSNGRTLCVPCHKATPTYLKGVLKREAFE